MNQIEQLQQIFDDSQKIVFFTGAGVSTESGIPDFRSASGIYHMNYRYSPEQVVSHSFFMSYPDEFYDFYKQRMVYPDARPNAAHLKMAEFEKKGKSLGVVTQNIDGLHQAAGSEKVYELHGSIHRNYCMRCGRKYGLEAVTDCEGTPKCSCGGTIRPDVVLYEEGLDENILTGALRAIEQADCLVITGTSLVVYPAAGLVNYFRGKYLVVINLENNMANSNASLVINGKVGEVLSQIEV